MPPPPSSAYATLSQPLPAKPYILGITPSSTSPHLLLRHPSSEISVVDAQSLKEVDRLRGGHKGLISSLVTDGNHVWTSGKDALIVRWDERSRTAASTISAFLRKPLPVLALAVSERDNLVIGGTELVGSEAHILFWDMRNTKEPAYAHNSTHSDDITHLSLLPSTSTFLSGPSPSSGPLPDRLLLSASTDGLVALSNMKETDEDEAVVTEENWGQSIAAASAYAVNGKGGMSVWARSDMDAVATWDIGRDAEGELELQNHVELASSEFRSRTFNPPQAGPSTVHTAEEERQGRGKLSSDYLIDVVPSLGVGKKGGPMVAVGSNDGDIILQYQASATSSYTPSAYFISGPGSSRGHKDVVRALYHDISNEAIYTGSEDGILSGWSLASLPNRLAIGNPEIDDDGGDGREDVMSDDEGDEESEIETESEDDRDDDDDRMDVDEGPRNGPIIGGGRGKAGGAQRREKRKDGRFDPY